MKIGFLLNHYDLHQVPHVVPYAFELSRQYQDSDVVIFGSTQGELDFAQDIGSGYRNHRCVFEKLRVPFFLEVFDPLLSKWVFLRKPVALRTNANRLSQFDALVVPEMTSLQLRKLPSFKKVKFIYVVHGAGDNRLGSLGVPYFITVRNLRDNNGGILDNAKANRLSLIQSANDLENIVVYPNPYRMQIAEPDLMFGNVPLESEILIYNASGQFIRRLTEENGAGGVSWDLRTETGNLVGSGAYIFLARFNDQEKKGKFLVIK